MARRVRKQGDHQEFVQAIAEKGRPYEHFQA